MIRLYTALILTVVWGLNSCQQRKKIPPEDNAIKFFNTISKAGGTWVHTPNDTTIPFESFIMKFDIVDGDTLKGQISGSAKNGDTLPFWKVTEYKDRLEGKIIFEQEGQGGKAIGISSFPDSITRVTSFEMEWSNGVSQRLKDMHTFLSDSTMLTESEIFDDSLQEWVRQPNAVWSLKQ